MKQGYVQIENKFYQESQVVMLPVKEKAEKCLVKYNGKHTSYQMWLYSPHTYYTQEYLKSADATAYHLYFFSDEEIKEGDWVYNTFSGNLFKINKVSVDGYSGVKQGSDGYTFYGLGMTVKKIIATTDKSLQSMVEMNSIVDGKAFSQLWSLPRPSNSFLEAFVREYNKGNKIEKVLVELVEGTAKFDDGDIEPIGDYFVKVASDNTITIKPVEAKSQFTKEELEAIRRFQSGEKWGCSTFIDEDSIVAGYGQLDNKNPYDFDYPLPRVYIEAVYGTTSWAKYLDDIKQRASGIAVEGKTVFYGVMLDNMQYYMEYCQRHGYVTPQDWLTNHKHF